MSTEVQALLRDQASSTCGSSLPSDEESGAYAGAGADRGGVVEPPRSPTLHDELRVAGHREEMSNHLSDSASGSPLLRGHEAGAHVSFSGSPLSESGSPLPPDQESGAPVSTDADRGGVVDPPRSPTLHDELRVAGHREEMSIHLSDGASGSPLPSSEATSAHASTSGSPPLRDQEAAANVSIAADGGVVIDPSRSTVPHDRLRAAVCREEVKSALLGLGWKPAVARAALAGALAALEMNATFDQLLREALRRCPRPSIAVRDG